MVSVNGMLNFLLVDDDRIFLTVAEYVVATLGDHRVVTASDGAAGLAALEASPGLFDYIILDLNMPRLDGLAFLRGAAANGFTGGVIISSGENEAIVRAARRMGEMLRVNVIGALKKPLDPHSLQTLLNLSAEEVAQEGGLPGTSPAIGLETLELLPYYQSQHEVGSGSIVGIEALIRARGPDGQIHGPVRLFSQVRGHDELVATTLNIARKVLDDVRAWKGHGLRPRTSINLDARVAEDPSVGPTLIELVRERQLDPAQICLELTETAFPEDMTRLMEVMTRLRMAGFELSLDDYGTGVSNFELLRLCPFTELKIDGTVMRSAPNEPIARRFIQSAVAMARDLDMTVVGEGIETEAQLATARQLGVTTIQGFLFSRPVSFEDMLLELSAAAPRLEVRAC